MPHNIRIDNDLETGIGLEYLCIGLLKELTLVEVSNGHSKFHVTACHVRQLDTWNVQGVLSFDSPLLPIDVIENTVVLDEAIIDILREVAGVRVDGRPFDLSRFCSFSLAPSYRSDEYKAARDEEIPPAIELLRQEVACITLVMGHLYDAANKTMFGLSEPIIPMLQESFLPFLPRDEALHDVFFDEARSQQVREGIQQINFLCKTADELLIKPKDERTIN